MAVGGILACCRTSPCSCPDLPASLTLIFAGITKFSDVDIGTATADQFSYDLSGVDFNGSFNVTSDQECPTFYIGLVGHGVQYSEDHGPFDPITGDPLPIAVDFFTSVSFVEFPPGSGTYLASVQILASGIGTGAFDLGAFASEITTDGECDREPLDDGNNTLPTDNPQLGVIADGVNIAYGGTVTIAP
jgi:hypothetical protein